MLSLILAVENCLVYIINPGDDIESSIKEFEFDGDKIREVVFASNNASLKDVFNGKRGAYPKEWRVSVLPENYSEYRAFSDLFHYCIDNVVFATSENSRQEIMSLFENNTYDFVVKGNENITTKYALEDILQGKIQLEFTTPMYFTKMAASSAFVRSDEIDLEDPCRIKLFWLYLSDKAMFGKVVENGLRQQSGAKCSEVPRIFEELGHTDLFSEYKGYIGHYLGEM